MAVAEWRLLLRHVEVGIGGSEFTGVICSVVCGGVKGSGILLTLSLPDCLFRAIEDIDKRLGCDLFAFRALQTRSRGLNVPLE